MKVNENLELLGSGGTFNIYTLSDNSLIPHKIDDNDISFLHVLIKAYDRSNRSVFSPIISREMNNVLVVDMPSYPLPGFTTRSGQPVVNLSPINAAQISDYTPSDIYTAFVYSIVFSNYVKNKPFRDTLEDQVSLFIFNSFMSMFGKKSGLVGSFSNLVPKLRYIVSMYTHERFFGNRIDDRFKSKISSFLHVNPETIKLNYDFSKPDHFLRCINENNIMSISENKFATDIIRTSGVPSIPMFEDISRLFSTILATTVKGNNIFSSYWSKKSKSIFEKMYYYGVKAIK